MDTKVRMFGSYSSSDCLRVLFVTDAPSIGGSEVYMRELIPPMRAFGIHAEVAMPAVNETLTFRQELEQRQIPVHAYQDLSEIKAIEQNSQLTILSSWNPRGYQKYYKTLSGPFVSLIHDQLMLHIPLLPQAIYRAFYEVLAARDIRGAHHIVTVSHWAAEYLKRHHKMRQVHAVPNGVDVDKFHPSEKGERKTLRQQYGFDRFTVLTPARMSIEKNHPMVLRVARALPTLDFVLVGTGYLEPTLKRLASENVRFLGKRNDMPELYRAADVVFQPTIAENQSLATLEALASGTPVITNDIPAQRELIRFGREGYLVNNGCDGYVTVLRASARNPQGIKEMGKIARERVLNGHTAKQNAKSLALLLWQLSRSTHE